MTTQTGQYGTIGLGAEITRQHKDGLPEGYDPRLLVPAQGGRVSAAFISQGTNPCLNAETVLDYMGKGPVRRKKSIIVYPPKIDKL